MPLRHVPVSLPTTTPDGSYDADLVATYRTGCLTPSDFPSLFGENPKLGYWALWQRKHNAETASEASTGVSAARAFRPVIARVVAEAQRFQIARTRDFVLHPRNAHAGAVMPYSITGGDPRVGTEGPGILVPAFLHPFDFEQNWRSSQGALRPPAREFIKLQALYYVTGRTWGGIGAQVNSDTHYFDVPRDDAFIAELEGRAAKFWASIAAHQEPAPDYRAEADAVLARYVETDKNATVEDPKTLAAIEPVARRLRELEAERAEISPRLKAIDRDIRTERARLAKLMMTAHLARPGRFLVIKNTVARDGYMVEPSTYSTFTIKEAEPIASEAVQLGAA